MSVIKPLRSEIYNAESPGIGSSESKIVQRYCMRRKSLLKIPEVILLTSNIPFVQSK